MDLATYQQHRFMELMGAVWVASVNLLSGMGDSLGLVNVQLAELRATNSTHLALKQLILHRDELQQHLEELIYQGQKMVEGFASQTDTTPAVQKALLTRSFYLCVTKAGIGTAMIRGIENKRAFDSLIAQVKSLYQQLGRDPAVRKAIAAEEVAEKKRLALEAQRQAEEEQQRLEEERPNTPVPVTVFRTNTATGGMYEVEVAINGQRAGAVYGDQKLELRLRPGTYTMEVGGGGLSNSLNFTVEPGQSLEFEMYFSNWGILGGGLVLRSAHGR